MTYLIKIDMIQRKFVIENNLGMSFRDASSMDTSTRPNLRSLLTKEPGVHHLKVITVDDHASSPATSTREGRFDSAGETPGGELLAELEEASARLESASPEEIVQWATQRFGTKLTMATAFGPEGMVLIHILSEVARDTPIFNLDSGYQFPETLALRERIAQKYGMEVELKKPELSVEQYEQLHKGPLYRTDPDRCCFDRKIRALRQAIKGMDAWLTAIRRDQSPDRARAPIVGWDKKFQLVKVNPLANWNRQQVWKTIMEHDIPYNPLHDQGYTSIGCWPCTRVVTLGEDERAGRWSGTAKTECGLHSLEDEDD